MSKINELIQTLCPDGVEYKTLKDVLTIKNGRDYKSFNQGNVPVYGSGGIMAYVDTYAYDGPSVLIPRKGSLSNIFYVEGQFWTVDTIFYTIIDESQVLPKYVFYYLQNAHLEKLNQAGGVPSLSQGVLNPYPIPVPPLPVQEEIVRILDEYTKLEAELEAKLSEEIELKQKQYEVYRARLLNDDSYDGYTLPEISENCDSQRKPITSSQRVSGSTPYYGASGIVDYVDDYIFDGEYLLISEDGANLLARSTPIAFSISGKTWVNNHAHILKFESYYTQKWVEYYFNSIDLSLYITGGAQPKLNQKNLNKIVIPVPSPTEQERIVKILDKYDTYTRDMISALNTELESRKKQYVYYRDQLLTFKRKE